MSDLAELTRRWLVGWCLARGVGPAEDAGGGVMRVHFGLPHRHAELFASYVDGDPDPVRRLAKEVADAPHRDWLTVLTTRPEAVEPILTEAGLVLLDEPERLMRHDLRQHPVRPPVEPYVCTTSAVGPVIEAKVTCRPGEVAAHGTIAVAGTDAVAHDIVTAPAHRRRGLGSVVMGALTREALARGATTGLLFASPDGERLYSTLGWTPLATTFTAAAPDPRS